MYRIQFYCPGQSVNSCDTLSTSFRPLFKDELSRDALEGEGYIRC